MRHLRDLDGLAHLEDEIALEPLPMAPAWMINCAASSIDMKKRVISGWDNGHRPTMYYSVF
jgi:hypothetical protein